MAINGANRPSINNVLEQLLEIINHKFDLRKKVSVNMELMQSNAVQMATYGIVIGITQLTLTLVANFVTATKSNYGCELFGHAQFLQEVQVQPHAQSNYAPDHSKGAGGCRRHGGPQGRTGTRHRTEQLRKLGNVLFLPRPF